MKATSSLVLAAASLVAAGLVAPVYAEQEPGFFKQAGSEPNYVPGDFEPAPETIKSRYGKLEFPDGYPTEQTIATIYDELDLQRATQLYLDMYPALSAHGMMKGWVRDFDMTDSADVLVTANRLDSTQLILTGNTESLYAFMVFDLKANGPTVVEVPPGVMGPIDDHRFLFLADVGPTGQDRGKGGKYLLLPPGYDGDVPAGYFVVQAETYMGFSFLRANADKVGFGDKALKFYRKNAKVYPLSSGPQEPRVMNVTGLAANTLVPEDGDAFRWMHEIISYEPAEAFSKEQLGKLASLGIEKGKPIDPDARMHKIFAQAAAEGVAMSRVLAFDSRDENAKVYPDRQWESPYITNNSTFYQNDYINLGARTAFHFTADGITPAMAMQMPEGKGSRYQTTYKDGEGRPLDGNETYKLNMLPNVPVALFWAVTVYDPWTRSELQSQPYPSISSQQEKPPVVNADGSIDIYFSNQKPKDIADSNWVKTLPDQGFFVYIRYYGPLNAFNEKQWIPNDVELVK